MLLLWQIPLNGKSIKYQQDTLKNNELTHIRWFAEYPLTDKKAKKKGFFGQVGEFIFGQGPLVLSKPIAIEADSPSAFFVLDQKTMAVARIFDDKGKTLKPKTKLEVPPSSLVDFCKVPGQGFYITDSRQNRIYHLSEDGKKASILETDYELAQPTGIAFLKEANQLWVLETKSHRVTILSLEGKQLKSFGTRGNKAGEFNYPTHIWIDDAGKVYIVDSMNYRIQIFDKNGGWISMFGQAGDASGYFARPKGVATDSHGNVYVADALFNNVQIFDREGNYLYNFGKQGRDRGDFWMPNGIYIDREDYIYVADSYNSRVQVFQLINYQ